MATTVIVKFNVKPGHKEKLIEALKGVQASAIKAGCKRISVLNDRNSSERVFELEIWNAQADHERYAEILQEAGMLAPIEALLTTPIEVFYSEEVQTSVA